MKTDQSTFNTKMKVGIFGLVGLGLLGALTVYVNDRPYWWKGCQHVQITVEDATGLKSKSPVRSLGLEIGYLEDIQLSGEEVMLKICVTAPVEVTETTRAYLRGEGFLGDKFVELKPVRYLKDKKRYAKNSSTRQSSASQAQSQSSATAQSTPTETPVKKVPTVAPSPTEPASAEKSGNRVLPALERIAFFILDASVSSAHAQGAAVETQGAPAGGIDAGAKTVPVGERNGDINSVVKQVDKLAVEMTELTHNLKEALNPDDVRATLKQLNLTLQNASKTLSPEGGLNTTAQRTLAKLEDAIEQFRDIMSRINRGEGSVGRMINDPVFANELEAAMKNLNSFLNKASRLRLVIDIGGAQIPAYNGGRGYASLALWPNDSRYYLLGVAVDPRGRLNITTTKTEGPNGVVTTTKVTQTQFTSFVLTGMIGKLFFDHRLDLSIGAQYGDATLSWALRMGPKFKEDRIQFRHDLYSRPGPGFGLDNRLSVILRPFMSTYVKGGLEGLHKVDGKMAYYFGAGLSFDDEDIKSLLTLMF